MRPTPADFQNRAPPKASFVTRLRPFRLRGLSRMAGVASAQEEIDETTRKFPRPRGAKTRLELLGQLGRAN
jgi:hypothetical protein